MSLICLYLKVQIIKGKLFLETCSGIYITEKHQQQNKGAPAGWPKCTLLFLPTVKCKKNTWEKRSKDALHENQQKDTLLVVFFIIISG